MGKLLDIAALKNISVAVNEIGCFYVWGLYAGYMLYTPHATVYKNMYDVFASANVMYKPLILSAGDHEYVNQDSNVMRCIKNVFDDPVCFCLIFCFCMHFSIFKKSKKLILRF